MGWLIAMRFPAARTGAREVVVRDPGTDDWTSAVIAALAATGTGRPAVLVLTPVFWTDGRVLDLPAIMDAARSTAGARGTTLIIDATHTAGVTSQTFTQLEPDFIVFPAFKWLLGPIGLAFLIAARHRQDGEPADRNGYNCTTDAEMGFSGFRPGAMRFDMGERDSLCACLHAEAALGLLGGLDREAERARLKAFADQIAGHAQSLGFAVSGGSAAMPHVLGLALPQTVRGDAQRTLRDHGVVVSERGGGLRISPYLHTDEEDVHRLKRGLTAVAEQCSQSARLAHAPAKLLSEATPTTEG